MWHIQRLERCIEGLVGKPEGKRPRGTPRQDVKILGWMVKKQVGMAWTGFIWLRTGTSGGLV
jgi:hypothetical protein